jgi:hypothetical protein
MPKFNNHWREPEPSPIRPPTLLPDPSTAPDKVAGTASELPQPGTPEDAVKSELRLKNARLRQRINSVLEQHPELRDVTDELAVKQGTRIRAGTPFLERIQDNLQERARAIIERRPDLEHFFDD